MLTSPQLRAVQTCDLLGLQGEPVALLREWDFGELEGSRVSEVRASRPHWNIWDGPVDGGESTTQVSQRAAMLLPILDARSDRNTLVVGHRYLFQHLAATWLGLPNSGARHFELWPAHLSILGSEPSGRTLRLWNASPDMLKSLISSEN